MPSSTFNFERAIPGISFRSIALAVLLLTLGATISWEIYCRSLGYGPTLNDTADLWADRRAAVKPDSLVIVGASRALYDLDLDQLEKGLGDRPIQLALVGSSAYPILADLADDSTFRGTVIAGIVPLLMMVPSGPPLEASLKALKHYREQNISQKLSQKLGMLLEERLAFLKQEDLTLGALLSEIPLKNRPEALIPPRTPPYFYSLDKERRARMFEPAAHPGALQTRIQEGWPPLFSPPPPPNWVPAEAFQKKTGELIEARFRDIASAVAKIRARGGRVVFVRFPVSGKLKQIEDMASPRAGIWSRILKDTNAPGIYFEDYPELSQFVCPEWSHLSADDSVEFTRRLIPHLKAALGVK